MVVYIYLLGLTRAIAELGKHTFHPGNRLVITYFVRRFDRRFRIYDISDFGETIRTYKRTDKDVILNEMILAGRGAAPTYEGK